ncbi:hypothetical protein BN2497_6519 [Janthinobacterium sp. CG23_2]|nr:hypothetical protein BN2497_6519 [Janthinobacterium sp. CG23_2]CUU29657.1 hypothetical protein BN3177_6519 [Janthinobacterium sp. CG23_2]
MFLAPGGRVWLVASNGHGCVCKVRHGKKTSAGMAPQHSIG